MFEFWYVCSLYEGLLFVVYPSLLSLSAHLGNKSTVAEYLSRVSHHADTCMHHFYRSSPYHCRHGHLSFLPHISWKVLDPLGSLENIPWSWRQWWVRRGHVTPTIQSWWIVGVPENAGGRTLFLLRWTGQQVWELCSCHHPEEGACRWTPWHSERIREGKKADLKTQRSYCMQLPKISPVFWTL